MLEHLNATPVAPRRVVIVGAHGFVGGALARRLAAQGVPVLALQRSDVDLLLPDAADQLRRRLQPGDALVAAAAIAPCRTGEMLRDNVGLALAQARAASASALSHVVNIGSDAVYADSPQPLTEASPAAPETMHGVMHLAREIVLRDAVKAPLALVRPTLLYGAGDPHNGYGPNRFRRLAAKGEPIVLFGEGEERRDHVLIDDAAEIVARILFRRSAGVLNIATGTVASFRVIAELVAAIAPAPVPIRSSARLGPMPHNGYRPFDSSACRRAFPDFAYTPLAEGLARAQREGQAAE